MVTKLPRLFDIFSPSTWRWPLCIQTLAMTGVPKQQRLCAISFSWCGNTRSMPPPWMSKVSPRCCQLIAEHSRCQPGRPRPHGLSQPGSAGADGFHSTKSVGTALVGRDLGRGSRRSARRCPCWRGGRSPSHRRHVEQHVALRGIGVAVGDQPLDDRDHRRDVVRRARLQRRRQAAERCRVGVEDRDHLVGQRADRDAALGGAPR